MRPYEVKMAKNNGGSPKHSGVQIEELLEKANGIYKLTILAARRSIELSRGAGKLIDICPKTKWSTVALEEIRQGKIGYKKIDIEDAQPKS